MDSENNVARWSRASRIVQGIGIVALVGLAAAAIYFWSEDSSTAKRSGDSSQPTNDPDKERAESNKDSGSQVVRLSPEMARKYGLRTDIARKRRLVCEVDAPARIAFNSEATAVIGTPVQGRVVDVMVRQGDHVEAGAVLAEIESAELGEAESDYLQRQAAARTAKGAIQPLAEIFERIKKLHVENKLIGITEVQERELDLKKAEGALANAQAAVDAAATKLRLLGMTDEGIYALLKSGKVMPRYAFRSPLAGEVIERWVNLGELVKPDREKLFVVADTRTLWVLADVPEARAAEVGLGCTAQVKLSTVGDQSFIGVVSNVSPSIDEPTRSLRVRIELKSSPELRPGMFAQATIHGKSSSETAEPVLAVPGTAVQTINGSPAVFTPDNKDPGAFQVRVVRIGKDVNGMVTIASGLEQGESVVTGGSAILKAELLKSSAKDED